MKMDADEEDFFEDVATGSYALWELFLTVKTMNSEYSEDQVIDRGMSILRSWVDRGWIISGEEILAFAVAAGQNASDPSLAGQCPEFELTEKAFAESGLTRP